MLSGPGKSGAAEASAGGDSSGPTTPTRSPEPVTDQGGASNDDAPSTGGEGEFASSECTSPVSRELTAWQPRAHEDAAVATVLDHAREVVAGQWQGVVTTPWVAPYAVTLGFTSDGGYSAHCDQNSDFGGGSGCCRAFYYGSDLDSDLKRWTLSSVNEQGTVAGDIDIAFHYGADFGLPAWPGKLANLDYDRTEDRLRFEFWHEGYGPVQFDLERVAPGAD